MQSPAGTSGAFAGLFRSKAPATTPTAVRVAPPTPLAPTPASTPATAVPKGALTGNLGDGYGTSNLTDPASARPLLTYENPKANSSQLLSDRTAPTFDPTVPQKVDPKVLQDPRMAQSVSEGIRKAVGATAYEELDHIMPLELGGSNNKTNLRLEPADNSTQPYGGSNPTPTDPLENSLAAAVHSGQMSLTDAWKQMAKAKGITLPEDGGTVPNLGQKNIQPNTQANEQPKPSLANTVGSFFSHIFNTVKQGATNAAEYIAENNPITRAAADIQGSGVKGGIEKFGSDLENKLIGGEARFQKDSSGKKVFNPGTLSQAAIGAEIAGPEKVFGQSTLDAIASETEPAKISSMLQEKGITPDAADKISPLLSQTRTADQVKGILQAAGEHGLLYDEDTEGLAKEFEGQNNPQPEEQKQLPAADELPKNEEAPLPPEKIPTVNLDEQAKNEALTKTVAGSGKGVKALDADSQKIYRDWVNQSGESNKAISGRIAAEPFTALKGQGMDAVHAFQSGDRTGQLADVEKWSKDLLAKEQAAGIPVEAKKNYLPQYWANSPAEVQTAQEKYAGQNPGKAISLKPGFSKESVFPDYKTGMQYGLTPKYNNIPDMINARARASEKALADRQFFEQAAAKGLVIPANHASDGWEVVPRFPKYPIKGSDGQIYNGQMAMPKPLADLVNNQLNPVEGTLNKALQKTATAATTLKQIVLTSGILPKTAINLHGFNELADTVPELFNHPSLFFNALKYMLYPKSAESFIETNLARAKEAALDGVQLGGEEKTINNLVGAFDPNGPLGKAGVLANKARQMLYNSFAKPLFEQMIPALKLQMYASEKDALVAKGMDAAEAGKLAASRSNKTFGGMNLAELGRDKNLQNFLKTFTLAPDFWEARYRYTGSAVTSLFTKGESAALYRKVALAIGSAYLAMTIANKVKTGHWMFENEAGHSMDVSLGQDSNGKNVWFRPFGTTLDLLRLPMDLAQSILQNGDVSGISTDIRDRVSALMQPIASLTYNTDAFGNKIFQPSTPTDPLAKQWGDFLGTLPVIPSNASNLSQITNPNQSKAQTLSQASGLPLRFNSANGAASSLADMIYTERTPLVEQIKKEYASGNSKDALNQMAQYNQALLQATIKAYQTAGHKVTDVQAFTAWLVSTNQAQGGIKNLLIKPPTAKAVSATQAKQGKPLFNKIFPSTITQ
jgi:hypothetical protein